MAKAFDKVVFERAFESSLSEVKKSEDVVKRELRTLSRTVLEAHHATENVHYINQLLGVLSPVNRRSCVEYFREFSGFKYDDTVKLFSKKDKKHYDDKHADAMEFLSDPLNNIWSWSDRHLKVEKKDPTIEGFTKYITNFVNKTQGKISHTDILKAVFKAGMKPEEIVEALAIFEEDVEIITEEEQSKRTAMSIAALM